MQEERLKSKASLAKGLTSQYILKVDWLSIIWPLSTVDVGEKEIKTGKPPKHMLKDTLLKFFPIIHNSIRPFLAIKKELG